MRLKLIGIIILLLVAAGCSAPGSQTAPPTELSDQAELPPTSTPEEVVASTETSIPAATSTSIPATPTVPVVKPAAIIARVAGGLNSFLVVGGSQNGNWLNAADTAAAVAFEDEFWIYSEFELEDQTHGQAPVLEPICNQYFMNVNLPSLEPRAVGVSGQWDVLLRTPLELSVDAEIHLRTITGWQIEQAPSMPIPKIDKVWMVDIEGNGTEEIFINGTRYAEPTGHNVEPRDYSVVLMQTEIGSEVVTIELVGDYYKEEAANHFPLTYNLEFIGDLNGDGKMEVVVGVSRWEGTGVMIFEIDGAEVQLVLSAMCSL